MGKHTVLMHKVRMFNPGHYEYQQRKLKHTLGNDKTVHSPLHIRELTASGKWLGTSLPLKSMYCTKRNIDWFGH